MSHDTSAVTAGRRRPPRAVSRLLGRLLRRLASWLCPAPAPPGQKTSSPVLRALMLAATSLPNVVPASAQAMEVEEAVFQYSRYGEGDKAMWTGPLGTVKQPDSLKVETLRANARFRLGDRTKLAVNLMRDTWSGATPFITAPEAFITVTGASAFPPDIGRVNKTTLVPMARNLANQWVEMPGLVNLMTSASPETRNQLNLGLSHEWDEFALELGAGISEEPDFRSGSLSVGGRWDFNRKLTTLSFGLSRSDSDIHANLGADNGFTHYDMYLNAASGPRITLVNAPGLVAGALDPNAEFLLFSGKRQDRSFNLGLSQVLDRNSTLSVGFVYDRSTGFLESPHKLSLLAFANPAALPGFPTQSNTNLFGVLEKRPDERNLKSWNLHWARYLPGLDAAFHLDYRQARDDWGIKSRAVELNWVQSLGNGWSLTPRLRHYAQRAADFYQPYFLFGQKYPQVAGQPGALDFSGLPIEYWSSDHRLSGFGARGLGLTLVKRFTRGLRLEMGLEHYVHAGKWGLNGGGEDHADFTSNMANIALAFDFSERPALDGGHAHHHGQSAAPAPAGVMNAHMLDTPGDFMVDYRYVRTRQSGAMSRGGRAIGDADILARCSALGCVAAPSRMTMDMHMLHLMYAPSENVNLMLMPQFMSMAMENRALAGGFYTPVGSHSHGDMDLSEHANGGVGDTVAGMLLRLFRNDRSEALLALGVGIPTGSVESRMVSHGGELMDYGMQTGSGTWDFLPSATWLGRAGAWSWGGQVNGVKRLEKRNASGYALGDVFQASTWAGYSPAPGLSIFLRAIHTAQGGIRGAMPGIEAVTDAFGNVTWPRSQFSPVDLSVNYGGRFNEIGLGLSAEVPGLGGRLGLEWLVPVADRPRGDQLVRRGSLAMNWGIVF